MAVCDVCGGLGRIRLDLPVSHADFGQLQPCPAVGFHLREKAADLSSQSGLKPHERIYRLSSIVDLSGTTRDLIEAVAGFVDEPRGWLYIWGGPGNGKTLALQAAVNELIERGVPALYVTLADLLGVMRSVYDLPGTPRADNGDEWRKWDSYAARFERIRSIRVLAVDEFDEEKVNKTGFSIEFRSRLIDHRYRDAIGETTATLFAGNGSPGRADGWIFDRIRDGRFAVLENKAKSVRRELSW